MNFGIVKRSPAMTVKQAQSVARQRIMLFQKGQPNSHVQLGCQVLKTADEIAVGKQRIAFQCGYGFGDPIPIAPHFRKQRQIRLGGMSFAAAIQSFFQIALQISLRKKLQQSDAESLHE